MKPIMTILILTIIALVLIAAGVQLCRPKDHGEYLRPDEMYIGHPITTFTKDGIITEFTHTPLYGAYMKSVYDLNGNCHSIGYFESKKKKP